jgi:hypothetical protein
MSWRDNSSSANRSSTNDGNGGSRSSNSGSGGGGGGGNYTFRSMGRGKEGNWNTGGAITGHGSLAGGIRRSQPMLPRAAPRPTGFNIPRPAIPPMPITPIMSPITPPPQIPIPRMNPWEKNFGTAIDYFDGQNPGGLFSSTFPARPGVSPRIGNRNKDQSRHPGMSSGRGLGNGGRNGGGWGGGGGGGW